MALSFNKLVSKQTPVPYKSTKLCRSVFFWQEMSREKAFMFHKSVMSMDLDADQRMSMDRFLSLNNKTATQQGRIYFVFLALKTRPVFVAFRAP